MYGAGGGRAAHLYGAGGGRAAHLYDVGVGKEGFGACKCMQVLTTAPSGGGKEGFGEV